jgi:hypothetical protein
MGYRIFYSYQSDIDKKLNLNFIRDAINDAICSITDYDIEPLIEGFYGVGGNPPLADKMVQQSQSSDIFIGDVTFTSSKIWHNPLSIVENAKSYSLEIPKGDLKPSPNPNVLIETGFSWALKSYERTVLVMNTAFGAPENLPVDMGDKRHPITYNLSLDRFNKEAKRKKEFEALCKALHDAILTVIKSDADYQRKRWAPMLLHNDWYQRDFSSIYRPTNTAKDIIKKLRIALEDTNRPQRIVGPKNSGKTRLVFELYRRIDQSLIEHVNIAHLIYYDLKGERFSDTVRIKFQDLKNSNQRKILVLDNCPIDVHREVFNQLPVESSISLLTIGNNENGEDASFFIDFDFAKETIEKLSNETGNPRNTNFIIDNSKGNLREAIAMIGKIPEGDVGLSQDYLIKWQQILGSKLYSVKTLKVLEELSLFTHVGYTDLFEKQSEILLVNTEIQSKDELNQIIEDLAETGIVKITGDFIILEAFIEELAASRLAKLTTEDLVNYFEKLTKLSLSKQFSNRLVELNKIKGTKGLIDSLSDKEGLFRKEAFINSEQGARILMSLAEIEPTIVLDILNKAFSNKTYAELKEIKDGRRYVVWALERLVYRHETFHGAANLLFKLSVAENEEIGNNATSQFCQLYQLFLPATTASLEERISLIKNLITNATNEEKSVIIKALDRALKTRGFTRMGGADNQAGVKFEDYRPKTNEEILNYWQSVIELLEKINAYDILVNKFNAQLHSGNANAMIDSITKMIKVTGGINKDLRQQFEYIINDQRELSPEIVGRVQSILDQYSSDTIREQLEYKVALAPYSTYKAEDGKIINKSEEKAIEFAGELILLNDADWLNEIDILLQNEQRLTFTFGKEIANKNSHFEKFIDAIIEKMASIPFEQQNNRLIVGYCSEIADEAYIRSIIDRFLANDKIAYHAIQLTRLLTINPSDLIKLKQLIDAHPMYIVSLQYLRLNNLTSNELIELTEWIKSKEPYGWWIAIDLIHNYVEKEDNIEHSILESIKSLLMKPGILIGENMHVPYAMHQYVELFKVLSINSLTKEFIEFLSLEIINASKEISLNHEYHLKDILEVLIQDHWEITWGIIGQKILEQDYYGWYNLKDLLFKIKVFQDDKLLAWMIQNPDKAPQKVIEFIDPVIKEDDKQIWSPLALEMFNRFASNQSFISALYADLHSYFWSGSLIPLLESKKQLLEQLKNHEKQEIREFAIENIAYMDNQIKRERKRDENDEINF